MTPHRGKEKPKYAYSKDLLLQDLQSDNLFFDSIVDMIPAKIYVAGNSGDDYNPKYFKGQAKESKEARRAKAKQAKRAKLDPNLAETTTAAKKRLEGGNRPLMPTAASDVAEAPPARVSPSHSSVEESNKSTDATAPSSSGSSNKNKSRIEALREKLHAKIVAKRGQRPSDPNTVSKRAARRADKKKRQEEAQQRKKRAASKAETNDNNKRFKAQNDSSGTAAANRNNNAAQDLAQLDFGRLAGLNQMSPDQYYKANKSLANMSKTKNLQKMLADAEAKKQRLQELAESNDPEDKTKAANIQWGTAIKEASGERVKDDPAKIKKAIKRQEVKKTKSAKAWKSRMDQTKQKMDERQKIRQHNLSKRKLGGSDGSNLSKKRIVTEEDKNNSKQQRLSRAGFEGRRQGFLNKKKEQ